MQEMKGSKVIEAIKPYSISEEEFRTPPVAIKPYTPPERVTRENFNDFLIKSFRVSMGKDAVQVDFMAWVKLKTGFDFGQTYENFLLAGGWDALSEAEKKEFIHQYENTPSPHQVRKRVNLGEKISKEFLRVKTTIFDGIHPKELKDIKTYEEFLDFAREEVIFLRRYREGKFYEESR